MKKKLVVLKPAVQEKETPTGENEKKEEIRDDNTGLIFDSLNTKISHNAMVQDALYFFPNSNNTNYTAMMIPDSFGNISEIYDNRVLSAVSVVKSTNSQELEDKFENEYRYYYNREHAMIAIDKVVSTMTTNIMSIIYNGTLALIRANCPDYKYRFVFEISHYDISRLVMDFLDSTECLDTTEDHDALTLNMLTLHSVLNSQILREVSYRLNDYLRIVLSDPEFNLPEFIRNMYKTHANTIFDSMNESVVSELVQGDFPPDFIFAYGCTQDYIREDLDKISEIIETGIVYLINNII